MTSPTNSVSSEARSCGKILRLKRAGARCNQLPPSPSQPPSNLCAPGNNWLSTLILHSTRYVANEAGKILSTMFGNETSSASDYSSASESEEDSDDYKEEGDSDNDYANAESIDQEPKTLMKGELLNFTWSSNSKRIIAQSLAHQALTREEGERLNEIIQSRIESAVTMMIRDADTLETEKLIEDKRSGSNFRSCLDLSTKDYTCIPRTSYWSTSSLDRMKLSKRPKHSLCGSWNISEEVRKIRLKEAEDCLKRKSPLKSK